MAAKSFTLALTAFDCADCPICTSAMPASAAFTRNSDVAASAVTVGLFEEEDEELSMFALLVESAFSTLSLDSLLLHAQAKRAVINKAAVTFFIYVCFNKNPACDPANRSREQYS